MATRSRRAALFAFATATAVLTTASAAFACVVFKGDLQVTATNTLTNTTQTGSRVTGANALHTYCPNVNGARPGVNAAGEAKTAPDVNPGGTVNVQVWPASACQSSTNMLSPTGTSTYDIRMYNGTSFTGGDGSGWSFVTGTGCFVVSDTTTSSTILKLGTISVTNGSGPPGGVTVDLVDDLVPTKKAKANLLPFEASSICVGSGLTGEGIFAPVQVLPLLL